MASVFDVAKYILEKSGEMTTIKLQKLVYYCQAWTLVWDEQPLFEEEIQAWANGPVVPELFRVHKGKFKVSASDFPCGNSEHLTDDEKGNIDIIIRDYGEKSTQWLVESTHSETPWVEARKGCAFGQNCTNVIDHAAMAEYYSGLLNSGN